MAITIEELHFPSHTGVADIHAKLWIPEGTPVAILQVAHGMAEHIERYHDFASFLAEQGILVAANDHAGHGKSVGEDKLHGYFGAENGWSNLVADIAMLRSMVSGRYPGIPYVMMGHSMGSFLMRTYASRQGAGNAAFIFSGTGGKNPAVSAGKLVAKLEKRRNGAKQPSTMLQNMSFGSFNKAFAPNRTNSDWLSRDGAQVDAYEADPLSGFVFTAEAMSDLFEGLTEISSEAWAAKVPDVPILMFSGDKDPVGANGEGVRQVAGWLEATGHRVTLKLYPEGRHEMLNEINRQEVYEDVLAFIRSVAK